MGAAMVVLAVIARRVPLFKGSVPGRFAVLANATGATVLLSGCGLVASAASIQDAEPIALAKLGHQATGRARSSVAGASLKQVDIELQAGPYIFRFRDAAALEVLDVTDHITNLPPGTIQPPLWWGITGGQIGAASSTGGGVLVRAPECGSFQKTVSPVPSEHILIS